MATPGLLSKLLKKHMIVHCSPAYELQQETLGVVALLGKGEAVAR